MSAGLVMANRPQRLQDVLHSPQFCLSKQPPSWTDRQLWETSTLPRTWRNDLGVTMIDRGWGSGIVSVEVPASSKNLRFPIWIGSFWLEILKVIEQKGR